MKDLETNPTVAKRKRWQKICHQEGKCDRCPPHDVENYGRRPKSDRHKNHRRP